MTKTILPVLRRTEIAPVVAEHPDIFNDETGLAGILLPLWIDKDQVLPCLAPRLLVRRQSVRRTIRSEEAVEAASHLDVERRLRLAELLLRLMSDNTLHTQLEMHTDSAPIATGIHHVNVLILPHALLFSHDDPGAYVEDNVEAFRSEVDKEETRAPLCTLLIPKPASAHQAIEQPDLVIKDFEIYRSLSALEVDAALSDLDLELAAPARQDIERIS